jgi:hypothetical protein
MAAHMVGSDGVCVWRESGVRRSVLCWRVWQESGFSRREDVFTLKSIYMELHNAVSTYKTKTASKPGRLGSEF